ncbi:MAG: M20/M25/M40 family metallo-hydrolase [Clostridia bacterium]|nr:M20/M25/M40 family metallo-hydrolase [Clostridia bacterium]
MLHQDYQNDAAVRALRLAIMQPTISGDDAGSFQRMHTLLRQLFPLVFSQGSCETVDGGALLIHLPGQRNARALVFCAHLDVVSAGAPERWSVPPFSGTVKDGYIYGRGAADMKGHLIALLSAAEGLLQEGWQPAGDIWFAFSCDEETRGGSMSSMARILQSRGVQPTFVLDEGGNISHPFALARQDAAYVGVCEKGRLLFTLSCEGTGAMETLARASLRVARIKPRYRLCAPVTDVMLPAMRPLLTREAKLFLRYPRIFGHGLLLRLRQTATGRAITQTQLSLWKQSGDALMREIPTLYYSASVLPGEETQKLLERVRRMLARTPITLRVNVLEEPGQVSPAQGLSWDALTTAIQVHFPGVRIVPCLLAGGTDSRHMECICKNVYRFSPFILPPEELARTHHYDERLSVENLRRGISFFRQMLQA